MKTAGGIHPLTKRFLPSHTRNNKQYFTIMDSNTNVKNIKFQKNVKKTFLTNFQCLIFILNFEKLKSMIYKALSSANQGLPDKTRHMHTKTQRFRFRFFNFWVLILKMRKKVKIDI